MADPGEKAAYHAQLEEQVKQRKEQEALDKQNSREVRGQILSSYFIQSSDSSGAGEDGGRPVGEAGSRGSLLEAVGHHRAGVL